MAYFDKYDVIFSDDRRTLMYCQKDFNGEYIIPSTVIEIGSEAFYGCFGLTSITIPTTVIKIGQSAFAGCFGLTSITIPTTVTEIGYCAFAGCSGLTAITIPNSVIHIASRAFDHCDSLSSLTISETVKNIEGNIISNCPVLIKLRVHPNNPKYDSREDCNAIIDTVTSTLVLGCKHTHIPSSIQEIGNGAFEYCSGLVSLTIPTTIKEIGRSAFWHCSSLVSITLPDNLIQIKDFTFTGCSALSCITIPTTVTKIGRGAFRDCSSLTSIILPDNLTKIEDYTFADCSALTSIIIPATVTEIGNEAFLNCYSLDSVVLPNNLKKIGENIFTNCKSLQVIRVPQGKKEEYCKLGLEPYRACIYETQDEEYTILLNIAKGYEMGIGMTKNLAQAVLIYNQAADKGCAEAAFHLGELYEQGDGLPQDYQQAIEWYTKAIALYHPSAETRKKHCEQVLRDEEQRMDKYQREIPSQLPQFPTTKYIFFDTECNGLPKYYNIDVCITSNWPRLIQLAWIVTDEAGNIVKRQNYVIKPNGFVINDKIAVLTSINTARAQREGVELVNALSEFMADIEEAQFVIGHNIDFDMHIVGCELFRENMNYNKLMTKPSICTMQKSTNFCAIPSNGNHAGYKWPKLEELHMKLFGTTFFGAHDALADVEATRKCYFELKKRGIL